MNAVKNFVQRVRNEARMKTRHVTTSGFGRKRVFVGYDLGNDTFVFENNIWENIENHSPVLIVKKSDVQKEVDGYIFTLSSGNHGVALVPLASGLFWNQGAMDRASRQKIINNCVLCANVVKGRLEISQREVNAARVMDADNWLQSFDLGVDEIIFSDRNIDILDIYRRIGQEWRVKPLAWNLKEMRAALQHSRTAINSKLKYYHSSAGVHFLSYDGFRTLLDLCEADYGEFITALKELVFIYKEQRHSNMRLIKRNNHHEIELFGVRVGAAENVIIPEIESLMVSLIHKKLNPAQIHDALRVILKLFKQSLESPELAVSESDMFIETMYIHLTGEIYQLDAAGSSTAFNARRVALPGATYVGNRPAFHPTADNRTKVLIKNVEQLLSCEEQLDYLNVYELRNNGAAPIGKAVTREIVYKTNRRPLAVGLIEKKLALKQIGYGGYLLARVHALKMLGVDVGRYSLISRSDKRGARLINFFLRDKCPGESLQYVKPTMLNEDTLDERTKEKIKDSVMALCSLLGNAAAQNLAMKKYIPSVNSCRFNDGKEIFEVGFDMLSGQEIPVRVQFCSMRGALGWQNTDCAEENLNSIFKFYMATFTKALVDFCDEYKSVIPRSECAELFFTGFECKTKEMFWIYMTNRDEFEIFNPVLPANYDFQKKWKFVLWSLEQQHHQIDVLRRQFVEGVKELKGERVKELKD